ncbi:hypothetical protein [Fusobacterium sp.]|uniref:hypothetical protein n=1 Tax=Fusobacterium sp. TaxID=68766 RepID=UPI00396C494E
MLLDIGFIYFKKHSEKKEINEAKIKICDIFKTYATDALNREKKYIINLNYNTKEIQVLKNSLKEIERVSLPENLYYTTIFKTGDTDNKVQTLFTATITRNGNITPSFSIYIFGYDKIAKYRISFYGFQVIKFMQINIYKNIKDKKATYENISFYHKYWDIHKDKWKKE